MAEHAILLCFDDRILQGAGVTILSLIDSAQNDTTYEINILHPGFDAEICAALEALVAGTRHSIRFFCVPPERLQGVPKGRGSWTEIVYYRLLASDVITDRNRILYSDVDVFITSDLSEVAETDLTDLEWAGVPLERNGPDMVVHTYFPENTKEVVVASGFMLMNLDLMRREGAVARYFKTIDQVGDRLRFFDLDLLNIATPKIGHLPFRYCVLEDAYEMPEIKASAEWPSLSTVYSEADIELARRDPAIIHYAGRRGKPWQRRDVPPYYAAVLKRLPRRLCAFNFRTWRRRWLSGKGHRSYPTRTFSSQ